MSSEANPATTRQCHAVPTVLLLTPPYREQRTALHLDWHTEVAPPRGSIVVIRTSVDALWSDLVTQVRSLHRRVATCPVALWTDALSSDRVAHHAVMGARLGIRAFLFGPSIDLLRLREQLADPAAFPGQLASWLEQRGFSLAPHLREQLESISDCDLQLRTFGEYLRATEQKERPYRVQFKRGGLGTPAAWFHVLRIVRVAVTIQAQPDTAVTTLAERYGFFDVAHLRRRLDDVIGANPSLIRKHLGWEWMIFLALRRSGLAPSKVSRRHATDGESVGAQSKNWA